jgi:carboxyl-terminal processing protease
MLDNGIGYIQVLEFSQSAVEQFETAIQNLKDAGMEKLVVDLRNNPGGLLTAVCDILEMVQPEGLIVYTEDRNGKREEYSSKKGDRRLNCPIAVLVNEYSASASEIFAGALQDYDKAYIIGTQSFGKGIVQSMMSLKDGSAFKITIEDYYTPNGKNIHGIGITPDEVVEFDAEAYNKDGTDNQLNAAIEYLTK